MKAAFLSAALFGLLATAVPIDKRLDLSITENDIKNGICRNITVIFARGTTELGNVGADAGPPFFNALELAVGAGKVAVQGVDYPADIPGYLVGGSPAGGTTMANLTTQAATQCPDTQIVLSGYRYDFGRSDETFDTKKKTAKVLNLSISLRSKSPLKSPLESPPW
ncbi:MAG: hypothetical protein M1819_003016 [Sarea resinae]|nr:MAG: hypothetical protein M1819_003016 [Sarea resinae]